MIVFGGLPGVGKTTIARALALRLRAFHLRVDSLEQALVNSGLVASQWDLGPAGYCAAYALAADNLGLGLGVVADCVNPLKITRDAWRQIAQDARTPCLEIELVCTDKTEHRHRVESRLADIPGLKLPDWQAVETREYEPWDRERLLIDTSQTSIMQAIEMICADVKQARMCGS